MVKIKVSKAYGSEIRYFGTAYGLEMFDKENKYGIHLEQLHLDCVSGTRMSLKTDKISTLLFVFSTQTKKLPV